MTYHTPAVVTSGEVATKTRNCICIPPRALDGGTVPSVWKTIG